MTPQAFFLEGIKLLTEFSGLPETQLARLQLPDFAAFAKKLTTSAVHRQLLAC